MMNFEKKKPGDTINVFSWNALLEEMNTLKKQRDWLLHNNSVIPHLDCAITTEEELLAAMESDEKCETCQGHGVVDQHSGNITLNAIITCKDCSGTGKKKHGDYKTLEPLKNCHNCAHGALDDKHRSYCSIRSGLICYQFKDKNVLLSPFAMTNWAPKDDATAVQKPSISDAKIGRVNIAEYPLATKKPMTKEKSPCDACGNAGKRRGRLFCNFGGYLDHFKAPKSGCDGVEHFTPKQESIKVNEN